jgi:hypothetical protein
LSLALNISRVSIEVGAAQTHDYVALTVGVLVILTGLGIWVYFYNEYLEDKRMYPWKYS